MKTHEYFFALLASACLFVCCCSPEPRGLNPADLGFTLDGTNMFRCVGPVKRMIVHHYMIDSVYFKNPVVRGVELRENGTVQSSFKTIPFKIGGHLTSTNLDEYDEKGREVSNVSLTNLSGLYYAFEDAKEGTNVWRCSARALPISGEISGEGPSLWVFDGKGRVIKKTEDGHVVFELVSEQGFDIRKEYDFEGNQVSCDTLTVEKKDKERDHDSGRFGYDSRGNWVVNLCSENRYVTVRYVQYFDGYSDYEEVPAILDEMGISVNLNDMCPECLGSQVCLECKGVGRIVSFNHETKTFSSVPCPGCGGEIDCEACSHDRLSYEEVTDDSQIETLDDAIRAVERIIKSSPIIGNHIKGNCVRRLLARAHMYYAKVLTCAMKNGSFPNVAAVDNNTE